MWRNRWLLLLLLLFVIIEAFGYIFYHAEDEICPKCDGSGEVWIEGYPSLGVFGYWSTCSNCGGTGFVWQCSAPTAVALCTLSFTSLFFGLFYLSYIVSAFRAAVNPWVIKVDRMDGPWFNPMYMAWLFSNDRRVWVAYTTFCSAIAASVLGTVLVYILTLGRVNLESSLLGFSIGCGFLTLIALSWYKCYWKPRTAESPVSLPESVEKEWKDKKL